MFIDFTANGIEENSIVWKSSDEDVVTVTQYGGIIANYFGESIITATSGKYSDSVKVSVIVDKTAAIIYIWVQ